jgi:hypothetical protein
VRSVTKGLCRIVAKAASVSGYSVSKCGAGFVRMWLDCKHSSRVTARAAAGVSVRAAARAAARADAMAAARNKPMRLIGSQLISQLSVA